MKQLYTRKTYDVDQFMLYVGEDNPFELDAWASWEP